jgi:P27 family predicted phage terminase small subunit
MNRACPYRFTYTREMDNFFGVHNMARPTKPTALKLVTGNPGKRALPKHEPQFRRGVGQPPETLDSVALQCWKRLSILLDRTGVLTAPDELALERMCAAYSDLQACEDLIKRDGRTYTTTGKDGNTLIKQNPAVAQLRAADTLFKSYLTEFGLTPAARSRVHAIPDDAAGDDPMARFFGTPTPRGPAISTPSCS